MDWKHANILIVEDNSGDAELIKLFFKAECLTNNYTICSSIAEAEQAITQDVYDLAFIDINLIDGSGLELLPRINPAITPVVMLSGEKDIGTMLEAKEGGAAGFIEKPLRRDSLRILMEEIDAIGLSIVVKAVS